MFIESIRMVIVILFIISSTLIAQDGFIKIKITGIEEIQGKISIGLFNSPEDFPKKNENSIGIQLDVNADSVEYIFKNLKKGEYAIAVFHDENSNGKMDRSFLGFPSEDYVFSNYATGSFGPPSFEDAKFILIDSLSIKLNIQE